MVSESRITCKEGYKSIMATRAQFEIAIIESYSEVSLDTEMDAFIALESSMRASMYS